MGHIYSPWRHGGWYVHTVRYPSGACGCVSRNYPDGKWRIACDSRPFAQQPTFANRDTAAHAEHALVLSLMLKDARDRLAGFIGAGCECDNTHEANNTECCLCQIRTVLREPAKEGA